MHNDYASYNSKFIENGFDVDTNLLSRSYRSSPTICEFVSEQLGIEIRSHRQDDTIIKFVDCPKRANQLFECRETIKLFYQSSNRYAGFTENWGATKGQNCYVNVCVVLNPNTLKHYNKLSLQNLPPQTKNKLYVACTRAKGNLYFVPEAMLKHHKQ